MLVAASYQSAINRVSSDCDIYNNVYNITRKVRGLSSAVIETRSGAECAKPNNREPLTDAHSTFT